MASGTLDADSLSEKRRWGEGNKVYSRKFHRKGVRITAVASTPTTGGESVVAAAASPKPSGIDVPRQSPQTLATKDSILEPPQVIEVVLSDDNNGNQLPVENGVVKPVVSRVDDRVKIHLKAAVSSKDEVQELRKKLLSELEQVRSLVQKLESKEAELATHLTAVVEEETDDVHPLHHEREMEQVRTFSHLQHSGNDVIDRRNLVMVNSEVGSVRNHQDLRPFRKLSVSVVDNGHGIGGFLEKEKRTPKANQYYRNSDFLLGKDRLPPESNKKSKTSSGKKHGRDVDHGFGFDRYRNQVFKNCSNLLQRLMKHKHGWVFNEPVNAKLLGLHDYHDIIKQPMDLGTVKSRLAQNLYKSPREFAEDVRLTFRNAMTYNPKGQDVHVMAEQLLNVFEERWAVIESEYQPDWRYGMIYDSGLQTPTSRKAPSFGRVPPMRTFDRSESMPASFSQRPSQFVPVARTPVPKKPKAKDPNKRDMTYEEKQKLSTNLQSLPAEKLDNIVQIIKKRSSSLSQHNDEIEVDIDSVDAETLWELDRFFTNYKKSLSKHKRRAEKALQARAESGPALLTMNPAPAITPSTKENKAGEKSLANNSPVQGERHRDNASRSSSSSSSSSDSGSSSSDSDSDSSSADGSDAGRSPRS